MEITYQSEEEMKVCFPLGREHDYIKDLFPTPVSNNKPVLKPGTYTEDGANSGGFDGRPDQPLDDRVGLWRNGSSSVNNTHHDVTRRSTYC